MSKMVNFRFDQQVWKGLKPFQTLVLLLAISLSTCKDGVQELLFFEVETNFKISELGKIELVGSIEDHLGAAQAADAGFDETGFVLAFDDSAAVAEKDFLKIQRQVVAPNFQNFTHVVFNLKQGQRLFFAAFAKMGKRLVYGEVKSYGVGDVILIEKFVGRKNDQAFIQIATIGLEALKSKADKHGVVYSPTEQMPVLNCPDCDTTELGTTNDDRQFFDTLPNLQLNTDYFARAYAEVNGQIFYSPTVLKFHIGDGWKFAGNLPEPLSDASFCSVGSVAFGGFGCSNSLGFCNSGDLTNDFFQCSVFGSGTTIFQKSTAVPQNFIPRTNASVFAIADTVYVFFGEQMNGGERTATKDFRKFVTSTKQWQVVVEPLDPTLPNYPRSRAGAAVFVIAGKAYFCGGEKLDSLGELRETNEVWQFDPTNSHWQKMADLPMLQFENSALDDTSGRKEALAFALEGKGYAGGGLLNGLMLKDFWQFTPPPLGGSMGQWTKVERMPAAASGRHRAVGFAIGKRGYVGTGEHLTDGELSDFWEFDPARSPAWQRRESFPGAPRFFTFGFSIGDFGYLGGGTGSAVGRLDVWKYFPE